MKKTIVAFLVLCSSSLSAIDLEIDMGSGVYYTQTDGKLVYTKDFWKDSSGDMDHDTAPTLYTWIEIESDQEYWPKVRFELSQLKTSGTSAIAIKTDSDTINDLIDLIEDQLGLNISELDLDSRLSQTNIETYLYYEYFEDTPWPSFGIGAGIKKFDFDYAVTIIDGLDFNDNGGDTIPLLFFKSRYIVDDKGNGSSLAMEGIAKYYIFGDSTVYDYLLKTDFMMKYNEDTNIGLEFGYKNTFIDIKGNDIDTVGGYMGTAGVYLGFVANFK